MADVTSTAELANAKAPKRRKKRKKVSISLYLMTLPVVIYMLINNYLPMLGIYLAFVKIDWSKGIFRSPFIGLKNFEFLFKSKDAFIMIRNTLGYNIVWILLGTTIAVIIALFMSELANSHSVFAKILQPIICFPGLISTVILSGLVYAFLSTQTGLLNHTIFAENPINWYATAAYWPLILTIVHLWSVSGQSSIIYMASISGVDKSIYESAKIDGATKLQQITKITLPLIRPMIIMMLLMNIGKIMNSDFGMFYQVPRNSGMLYNVTQTVDTYVYRALMEMNNVSMSSAASVFQSLVGFLLVVGTNLIVKKVDPESAIF